MSTADSAELIATAREFAAAARSIRAESRLLIETSRRTRIITTELRQRVQADRRLTQRNARPPLPRADSPRPTRNATDS